MVGFESPFFNAAKSTVSLFSFTAFSEAAWIARLVTRLNSALERRFSKSIPGLNRMFTALILSLEKSLSVAAGSQVMEMLKIPSSPNCTL